MERENPRKERCHDRKPEISMAAGLMWQRDTKGNHCTSNGRCWWAIADSDSQCPGNGNGTSQIHEDLDLAHTLVGPNESTAYIKNKWAKNKNNTISK